VLRLESNADVGLSARRLGLHQLEQPLDAARATWTNYGSGGTHRWVTPGGDYGVEVGHADVDAATKTGLVTFDVTASVSQSVGATEIPLSLIVLESGTARPAPAELAFVSAKGETADIPRVILLYCDP
jgi:hypothetical protein